MTKYSIALKINLRFTSLFRNKAIFSIIKFELIVRGWIMEFSVDGTTLTDFPELLISNSRVAFFVLLFIKKWSTNKLIDGLLLLERRNIQSE